MLYCIKTIQLIAVLLLAGVWLGSVPAALAETPAAAEKPRVVTSIKPLSMIARAVAADLVEVEQLLPDGEVPHHFTVRLSQQRLLHGADVFLWVGPELETPLVESVERLGERAAVIAVAGISGITRAGSDLHLWLAVDHARLVARVLAATLVEMSPRLAQPLNARLRDFERELGSAEKDITAMLGSRDIAYIAEHDAYGYFTANFASINLLGALRDSSGSDIGPRELARLYGLPQTDCLIAETSPTPLLLRLAEKLGRPVISIDPLGSEVAVDEGAYIALLKNIARGFSACNSAGQ